MSFKSNKFVKKVGVKSDLKEISKLVKRKEKIFLYTHIAMKNSIGNLIG